MTKTIEFNTLNEEDGGQPGEWSVGEAIDCAMNEAYLLDRVEGHEQALKRARELIMKHEQAKAGRK